MHLDPLLTQKNHQNASLESRPLCSRASFRKVLPRAEDRQEREVVVMLRPSASRQDSRKKSFKKSADAEESRRKREDQMIAIRKEKRDEAMAKKRINVGGGARGGEEQIHPNVFDTSDSTAMTHEQRTHAKVRRPQFRRKEGRRTVREICFFLRVPFVPVSREEGPFEHAGDFSRAGAMMNCRIFSFLFKTTFLYSRENSTTYLFVYTRD